LSEWLVKAKDQIADSNANIALEALYRCCDYIWCEPYLNRMIVRSQLVLHEVFEIPSLEFYDLSGKGTGVQMTRHFYGESTAKQLTPTLTEQIKLQMGLLNLDQEDYKSGINYLHIGKEQLVFILLGDSSSSWQLMIWQEPDRKNGDFSAAESARTAMAMNQALIFFVRQIQVIYLAHAKYQKAQSLLQRDDLTGLYNFRYLEASLDNEIKRVQRFRTKFSVLFIDLDHFKLINDNFGHLAGSRVIKHVADVLKDCLREVDSVFRYGGDEYVVLLIEANSDTALRAAERIRKKIAATEFPVDEQNKVHLTASIGVASCPEHARTKEELLRMADESMYQSKKSGKNRVQLVGGLLENNQPIADL